jgi:hypothetical protein
MEGEYPDTRLEFCVPVLHSFRLSIYDFHEGICKGFPV